MAPGLLRMSVVRLRGPGATLCMPQQTSSSHGPYSTRKFILPKIPRDFNNDLGCGNARRLTVQAEQYILNPDRPFRDTLPIFLRRCLEEADRLSALEMALILRAIVERGADPEQHVLARFLTVLLHRERPRAGAISMYPPEAVVALFDIFAAATPLAQPGLEHLATFVVPNSMHALNQADLRSILRSMQRAQLSTHALCARIAAKLSHLLQTVPNVYGVAEVAQLFVYHDFHCQPSWDCLCGQIISLGPESLQRSFNSLVSFLEAIQASLCCPSPTMLDELQEAAFATFTNRNKVAILEGHFSNLRARGLKLQHSSHPAKRDTWFSTSGTEKSSAADSARSRPLATRYWD